MNKGEEEDLCDHYFDIIIRRRNIPRRMNWRHHANALSLKIVNQKKVNTLKFLTRL
jgi:hypothetical protein